MARGKLFEYAIMHHPKQTKEQAERGDWPKSVLLKALTPVVEENETAVKIKAAREIPETHLEHLSEVEILVRPL